VAVLPANFVKPNGTPRVWGRLIQIKATAGIKNYSSKRRFFRHLGLCYKIIGWLLAQQQILELSLLGQADCQTQAAVWIRNTLLVRATFIKIGQLFSTVPIYFPANT